MIYEKIEIYFPPALFIHRFIIVNKFKELAFADFISIENSKTINHKPRQHQNLFIVSLFRVNCSIIYLVRIVYQVLKVTNNRPTLYLFCKLKRYLILTRTTMSINISWIIGMQFIIDYSAFSNELL